MKLKLATLAALLAASPAFADITNGPNPYAAGYGWDKPHEAAWGGWTRGDAGTIYAEWDTFTDASYPGTRTAAPDVGAHNVTNAHIAWNSGTFTAGSGNLYNFSGLQQSYTVSFDGGALPAGPVRAVMQTETWGNELTLSSILLNGVAPTSIAETYRDTNYPSSFGAVVISHRLFIWDLASAPANYSFALASPVHQSFAQVAFDVAAVPVPEAETYALMLAGLGLVGWQVRRRGKTAQPTA